jgi:hypothetical protein
VEFGGFGSLRVLSFGVFGGCGLRRLAGLRVYELLRFDGFGV